MRNKINVFLGLIGIVFIGACTQNDFQNTVTYTQYMANGRDLYQKNCENCHGKNGEGLGKLIPELSDTTWMRKHKSKLASYIKNGIANDTLHINGKTYIEKMPAHPQLQSIDIAQIIVYISNSFGNKQGFYSYNEAEKDLKK